MRLTASDGVDEVFSTFELVVGDTDNTGGGEDNGGGGAVTAGGTVSVFWLALLALRRRRT